MPPDSSIRIIAAATASSRPYSMEERSRYPWLTWLTWLLKNGKLAGRDNLVKRTKKSLRRNMNVMVPQTTSLLIEVAESSHSPYMEEPEYMMLDAWEGSITTGLMSGSSQAGSKSIGDTVRSHYFDSDYQGVPCYNGSGFRSVEGTVRGHDDLPLERTEENVPQEPELADAKEEDKVEDGRHPRSPRLANSLASLLLEAKWPPIRFENRLPGVKEEDEATYKMSFVSAAEEAPEEDSDEDGDGGLTRVQPNNASLWPGINEPSDPPRIPSPPWTNSMLLEEPRATTPEPVDPPRKKRRLY